MCIRDSYGGVEVDLGASDATPAFDLSDATAYPGDSSLVTVGTVTAGTWQGTAVANSYVASSSNWNTAYNDHITGVSYSSPTLTLTQKDAGTITASIPGGAATGTVDISGTPAADEFAQWTDADTIRGRSAANVRTDLGLVIGTNVLAQQTIGIANDNLVETDSASIADDDYAKFTSAGLEGRSYSEVKTDLSLSNVENTALSTWAGTTNITTLGTVTAGTWNGTAIANANLANDSVSYGGVEVDLGASDATPAFDLSDATNYEGTAIKSTGEGGGSKFLREDGDGTCSWQTPAGGGGTPGGSDTQIQYNDGGSSFGGISGFVWDDTDLKIDSDSIKLKFGDGQDMSIWHNGTDNYISGATGDIVIKNAASNEDIIFNANDGGSQTDMMTMDASLPAVQQHVGSIMDETKPTQGTGNDTVTMTHGTPFYSVTCDATVNAMPFTTDRTTAITLPAWEEGAYFRIAYKCVGAGSSPFGQATITIEASGSELIGHGYGNGETSAAVTVVQCTRAPNTPAYGILHAYAAEVYTDSSTSSKTELWILEGGPFEAQTA